MDVEEEEEEGGHTSKKANSMSSPCINMTATILPGVAGGHGGWGCVCCTGASVAMHIYFLFYLKECFEKVEIKRHAAASPI